ncbi:retinoblastoma-associated protein-like isoform X1 [Saccostrea echinata]|uniref:retinoblastoma-associated protein-like isoform X1 n=1 Tax=Saccostrea echinata TaxID=191078 RepID=UPI002A7FF6C0|nr:retinoblastoma-associated protein-like isoform X1 [Saccostrea echinata]
MSDKKDAGTSQLVPEISVDDNESFKNLIDVDLERLATSMELPKSIRTKANSVLESLQRQDEFKLISKSSALVCAIYIAAIDIRMPYGPSDPQLEIGYLEKPDITVTDILQKSETSVPVLFKWMNHFRDACLSEAVRFHLKHLEKEYCVVSALFHTHERLCSTIFKEEQKGDTSSIPLHTENCVTNKKQLCWVLFLLAKERLLTDGQIVEAFYILVCCYEYVLRTTPGFQLNSPYGEVQVAEDSERQSDLMLKTLSEQFDLSYEEVVLVQKNSVEPCFQRLFQGEKGMELSALTDQYEKDYKQKGDLNELLFLQNDPHLQPLEQNGNLSSPRYDEPDGPPITPVSDLIEKINTLSVNGDSVEATLRAALNTIQQLKKILSSTQDEPSPELLAHFKNCSQNPLTSIKERVNRMETVFINGFMQQTDRNQAAIAKQRYVLAKRLYYRVMEAMLNHERQRLSQTDFSKLLNIDSFHVSLLACALEIVMMTYGSSWNASFGTVCAGDSKFSFPWIIKTFGLHSYDFFKVLESFIKAEPILTKEIVKHLQGLEKKILEQLAWTAESPVFDALIKTETPALPVEVSPLTNTVSSADLYLSPMRVVTTKNRGLSPSYGQSPQKVSSPAQELTSPEKGTGKRSQSLTIFLNKVCRLGFHRLEQLTSLLNIPKDLQHKIWTCFEYCITKKTGLLKNRHLDQLMLCSVYGICKVAEKEIKFKVIIRTYSELPDASPSVYRHALIERGEYDSIIGFYNRVFMHNMKGYILQFAPTKQTPSLSPVPKTMTSPVYSIPSRRNFYVSPLKDSPFKAPQSPSNMTPRSRQLYSFGDLTGSNEKLQRINEAMSRAKNGTTGTTPKSQKRLRFDPPAESESAAAAVPTSEAPTVVKKVKMADNSLKPPTGTGESSGEDLQEIPR